MDTDESPRKDTNLEALAKLKPVFQKDGSVTAGNAPGLNDGASALVVTSLAFARRHGLKPLARVTGYATGGGEPKDLFFAPILAVQNLMKKTGATIGNYGLIEANEAFAVQALADGRALGWDWSRVNVRGGAVALGHPIGASGARVLTTLLYAMKDRGVGDRTRNPLPRWWQRRGAQRGGNVMTKTDTSGFAGGGRFVHWAARVRHRASARWSWRSPHRCASPCRSRQCRSRCRTLPC